MDGFNADSINAAAAEAANAPTRFNATERSAMIRTHVTQIRRLVQDGKTVDQIKLLFPDFSEKYPNLLEMLTMLDRMGRGNLSQHEASIKVGQHLLTQFVTPQVGGGAGGNTSTAPRR
jgi:hypothetical protein